MDSRTLSFAILPQTPPIIEKAKDNTNKQYKQNICIGIPFNPIILSLYTDIIAVMPPPLARINDVSKIEYILLP